MSILIEEIAKDLEANAADDKKTKRKWCGGKGVNVLKWTLATLLLFSGIIVVCAVDVKTLLTGTAAWVEEHKALGAFIFTGLYIVGTCVFLPGSLLALGAGALFGFNLGFPVVWTSGIVADSIAFFISRFLFRSFWLDKLKSLGQEMEALDQVTSDQGWKVVFLLRLAPFFPYSILNYAMGVTGISFTDYFLASAVGIIPGTLVYVYIGYKAKTLEAALSSHKGLHGGTGAALFCLTCIFLFGILYWIGAYARRLVQAQLQEKK